MKTKWEALFVQDGIIIATGNGSTKLVAGSRAGARLAHHLQKAERHSSGPIEMILRKIAWDSETRQWVAAPQRTAA